MGVTGGLVRSIFSRSRSFGVHEHNGRSNVGEKKRWSSVRSYLCGDEFNSVLAVDESKRFDTVSTMSPPLDSVLALEDSASVKTLNSVPADEDSASVKSSEETVTQPLQEDVSFGCNVVPVKKHIAEREDNQSEATETHIPKKHQTPISKLFREEDAAIIIQTAFRHYLATRRDRDVFSTLTKEERFASADSPSKESMGTSLEVQTDQSVKAFSFAQVRVSANQRTRQKTKTQVLKIKEDWDDSTMSSKMSKMRIQNRIEAMTRRERALAYAFSQQLRICSKKKQIERNEVDPNIGWSWLERWMATRVPESISVEQGLTHNQTEAITRNQILVMKKRPFGVAGELESCASNDVPLQLESISEALGEDNEDLRLGKNSLKATRNISKRKSGPSYQIHREYVKLQATKKDLQRETQRAKKSKSTPSAAKGKSMQINFN
ncbi:PREDICTED: uncharacterized protein LOC104808870 isoform X2 [Tarenaya hassleriana]|uniref:uncharacterized protein LOC104808870 isoform X2 n=1 Tax=Tarenaya hassleriana TaxID=28532 RepID=UPI0008FD10D1|nr:PREDICTED: uncharacterized protein LOC104808870 isoform X2 [Tarenaya hassleriana]